MVLTESILINNPCYKEGNKIKVQGLMLEGVRCPQPSAKVFVHNWNRESCDNKCVHAFIDANDGHVIQTLPWNHRGRHCGKHPRTKMSANGTHIGIKMCEPSQIRYKTKNEIILSGDKEKAVAAVKRTYDTAVTLFSFLCKEFNLDPKTAIISQKEGYEQGIAALHNDPELLWKTLGLNYSMEGFRQDVMLEMACNKYSDASEEKESLNLSVVAPSHEEVSVHDFKVTVCDEMVSSVIEESESFDSKITVNKSEFEVNKVGAPPIKEVEKPEPEFEEVPIPMEEKKVEDTIKKVKINTDKLRIRTSPEIGNNTTGKYTGKGIFEITEIQNGNGAKKGWGKLRNGAGWICLDFVELL